MYLDWIIGGAMQLNETDCQVEKYKNVWGPLDSALSVPTSDPLDPLLLSPYPSGSPPPPEEWDRSFGRVCAFLASLECAIQITRSGVSRCLFFCSSTRVSPPPLPFPS